MNKIERTEGRQARQLAAVEHLQRRIDTLVDHANTTANLNLTLKQRERISSGLSFLISVRDRTLANIQQAQGIKVADHLDEPFAPSARIGIKHEQLIQDQVTEGEVALTDHFMDRANHATVDDDMLATV
jgi:hypothetical protein